MEGQSQTKLLPFKMREGGLGEGMQEAPRRDKEIFLYRLQKETLAC